MGSRLKLQKYVHGFIDRHGKARHYLRRPGFKRVPLPDLPWSPTFMAAYEAGMQGEALPVEIGASKTKPGTISAAIVGYYTSGAWLSLRESTRKNRRAMLERFRKEHGRSASRCWSAGTSTRSSSARRRRPTPPTIC